MNSKSDTKAARARAAGASAASGPPAGTEDVPPFSRIFTVDPMPDDGLEIKVEASPEELAALAEADGLADLRQLAVAFSLRRGFRGRVSVRGRLSAAITQTCVVSLEPFDSEIAEEFEVDFQRIEDLERAEREKATLREPLLAEEEDPPDPIVDGKIDLGALAAEFLALSLDPYPRKPGISFDEILPNQPEDKESPFAVLRKWDKTS